MIASISNSNHNFHISCFSMLLLLWHTTLTAALPALGWRLGGAVSWDGYSLAFCGRPAQQTVVPSSLGLPLSSLFVKPHCVDALGIACLVCTPTQVVAFFCNGIDRRSIISNRGAKKGSVFSQAFAMFLHQYCAAL